MVCSAVPRMRFETTELRAAFEPMSNLIIQPSGLISNLPDSSAARRQSVGLRWVRLTDLIKSIEHEALDDAVSEYDLSVDHRMVRARVDAYNRQ